MLTLNLIVAGCRELFHRFIVAYTSLTYGSYLLLFPARSPRARVLAGTPGPGRYPYHNQSECPIEKSIKTSDEWQYYLGHPGEERVQCDCCMQLAASAAPHGAAEELLHRAG